MIGLGRLLLLIDANTSLGIGWMKDLLFILLSLSLPTSGRGVEHMSQRIKREGLSYVQAEQLHIEEDDDDDDEDEEDAAVELGCEPNDGLRKVKLLDDEYGCVDELAADEDDVVVVRVG